VASYEAHLGILDDNVIHENCQMEIENLNMQLTAAQSDVTNISIEKNKLESEVQTLRMQLQSVNRNVSVRIEIKFNKRKQAQPKSPG
jgi:uncharacterized protein (DUF3084 family)